MTEQGLWAVTLDLLQRSLDFRAERQNLIASNIANADTPRFEAKDLKFEQELQRATEAQGGVRLVRTDEKHLGGGVDILSARPEVVVTRPVAGSFDGNTVDVDEEMVKLAENNLLYNANTEALSRLLAIVKFSTNEGGGVR